MPPDVWIPLATGLTGALIGLAGTFIVTRANRIADKERWQREQRIDAYSQLTTASHALLFDKSTSIEEREGQFYAAYFRVSMVAGDEVYRAALEMYEVVVMNGSGRTGYDRGHEAARTLSNFTKTARVELGIVSGPLITQYLSKTPPS